MRPRHGSAVPAVPVLTGTGFSVPAAYSQQDLWNGFGRRYFHEHPLAARLWRSSGVQRRHLVVDPREEPVEGWSTGRRMDRYTAESLPLGRAAVADALRSARIDPADIGLFAVVSCTGYTTPGLDILLAQEFGMSPGVRRLTIGHMGCYAAIPGLGAAAEYVTARGRPALLLCLELTSLHLQPRLAAGLARRPEAEDVEQMVVHSLFADAAVAAVIRPDADDGAAGTVPGGSGFEVVDIVSVTAAESTEHMAWRITDQGFRMRLAATVPAVLGEHIRDAVTGLLDTYGLTLGEIDGFAVHPGGVAILRAIAAGLDLAEEDLAASYDVLREYGNCSSATVLLVLRRLLAAEGVRPGGHVLAVAFGPGLTLYVALLRRSG